MATAVIAQRTSIAPEKITDVGVYNLPNIRDDQRETFRLSSNDLLSSAATVYFALLRYMQPRNASGLDLVESCHANFHQACDYGGKIIWPSDPKVIRNILLGLEACLENTNIRDCALNCLDSTRSGAKGKMDSLLQKISEWQQRYYKPVAPDEIIRSS